METKFLPSPLASPREHMITAGKGLHLFPRFPRNRLGLLCCSSIIPVAGNMALAPQHGHSYQDMTKTSGQLSSRTHLLHRSFFFLTRSKRNSSCNLVTIEMDMPGKDNKEDASILCRLLEESTSTETFTDLSSPAISYSQPPSPPPPQYFETAQKATNKSFQCYISFK